MELIPITNTGNTETGIACMPKVADAIVQATIQMYEKAGYEPPWIGYLATENGRCVGTCGFKSCPFDGRVEIAYHTFPGNEGRGVATRMVKELVQLALETSPDIQIYAQTLPEESASTKVLRKAGFRMLKILDHPEDGRVWEWELPVRASG